jgi:hypothetical protein
MPSARAAFNFVVMPGLVPGIHEIPAGTSDVDGRTSPAMTAE